MKSISCSSFFFLMFACIFRTEICAQVSAQLQVLPPYSSYLSDYTSRPNRMVIILTNISNQVQQIYFTGSVTGDNGVSAQTKANYKPNTALQIQPHATVQYTGAQLSPLFNWDMGTLQGVNVQQVERSGILPQGNYRICVDLRDFATGNPIGSLQPSACSQSFNVIFSQPPVILEPVCGLARQWIFEDLDGTPYRPSRIDPPGQPILFRWTPVIPSPPAPVQYRLRIVEIIPPSRNADDALQSAATPPVLDITTPATTYMLNPQALLPGHKKGKVSFAFNVTAVDPLGKTVFSNNGVSEACEFSYGKDGDNLASTVRKKDSIWIEIGRRSKGCTGFGICAIHGVDSGKISANFTLSSDERSLAISLSEKDIIRNQPDKLVYFKEKGFVSFEDDWTAPPLLNSFLHTTAPIAIKTGQYPLIHSKGTYTIYTKLNSGPAINSNGNFQFTVQARISHHEQSDVYPAEEAKLDSLPCNSGDDRRVTWHRKYYNCVVDAAVHTTVGANESPEDLEKKQRGEGWGTKLLHKAISAGHIDQEVKIHPRMDIYIHMSRHFVDLVNTYYCINGIWVATWGKSIGEGEEDLGWHKLMIPHGDGSIGWTGVETGDDLKEAINAAAPAACTGAPVYIK